MKEILVVALGGNALIKPGQKGTVSEMRANIREALLNMAPVVRPDAQLVIAHGNGPQVGTLLLKDDAGKNVYDTPSYPLDVLVAETQGEIGYLIESELRNILRHDNPGRDVASLVTMIKVNPGDPGFENPQKRVGKMYSKEEAVRLAEEKKWRFAKEIKNGNEVYRRVVPSPEPIDVVNKEAIKTLLEKNFIVITAGGGGIPVYEKDGQLYPVEAVIDKDLASALTAELIGANKFIILTDVPYVYLNYGMPGQKPLKHIGVEQAEEMMQKGVFGSGNMLPKIKAAVRFARRTGKQSLITDFEGLKNNEGTLIG
jgi:carbamate kinase